MHTKHCARCDTTKNIRDFARNKSKKDGFSPTCRLCMKEYNKKHYRDNKEIYLKKSKLYKNSYKEKWEQFKKTLRCQRCDEDKFWRLAFHHVDPTMKEYNIASLTANLAPLKKVMNEIDKCIVVCHNCHADIHYGQRSSTSIKELSND